MSPCPERSSLKISGLNNTDCDLSGFDLSGLKFRGLDLTSVDLVSANLSNVVFIASSIKHSNLSGADLRGASMAGLELGPTVSLGRKPLRFDRNGCGWRSYQQCDNAGRDAELLAQSGARIHEVEDGIQPLVCLFRIGTADHQGFSMIAYEEYLAATGQTGLQPMKTEQIWAILLGLDRSFILQ